MIPLTVMNDIDGRTRSEDSEGIGTIETSGVCGAVRDLEAGTGSVNMFGGQTTKRAIYLGAIKRGAKTGGIGDDETVFGKGAQDSTRIVEKFKGLVTGVEDGHGNPQVFQSVDLDVGNRGLDGQAGSSADGDHRSDEGDEGGMDGEHYGVSSEGGWSGDSIKYQDWSNLV